MMRRTSILKGLQCFEAVARHMSMKLAARDLGVSESAISHQMREFSETIGQQLFVKSGRGTALTPAGERLLARIPAALAGLETLFEDIAGGSEPVLQLAVCSAFGPGWMAPRLTRFLDEHPKINMQLKLYAHDPMLTSEVADAMVTSFPVRRGYSSIFLMDERLVAVHHRDLQPAGDLSHFRLITTLPETAPEGDEWADFCMETGLDLAALRHGPYLRCSHFSLGLAMARNGVGIALVPDFLAKADLESGLLKLLSPQSFANGRSYHLCYRENRAADCTIRQLRDWLLKEVAQGSG